MSSTEAIVISEAEGDAKKPKGPFPKPPRKSHRAGLRLGDAIVPWVFLTPWLIGLVLLTFGPMMASLYFSFTDYDLFTTPKWVGLENYRALLDDKRFGQSVLVTLKYVFIAVPLKMALALVIAMLLARPRKGEGFFRAAFYLPSLLGTSVAVALVWRLLFSRDGVLDSAASSIGLTGIGMIDSPSFALYYVILLAVWQFGAPMVIFLAGLKQIPQELYDAAAVDGAKRWRTFISVTLPMLSPVIFFNLLLELINAFQSFTAAFVISGGTGGPSDSTLIFTLYLYEQAFTRFNMGYASALAWVVVLGIGVITLLLFASSKKWVFYASEGK